MSVSLTLTASPISLDWVTLDEVKKILKEIVEKFAEGAKRSGIVVTADIRLDADERWR
jgi:uncharacterized protein YqgV (UPF0045/DUF77 family)